MVIHPDAISTHAPRTGSDPHPRSIQDLDRRHFNPRSPHGERLTIRGAIDEVYEFQPTLPARGATRISCTRCGTTLFQPTLPARGATAAGCSSGCARRTFQPTLPARGATHVNAFIARAGLISTHAPRTGSDAAAAEKAGVTIEISTHAPRTGSDGCGKGAYITQLYFNPRSPHGERPPESMLYGVPSFSFQPTLPARGATWKMCLRGGQVVISTHAPRTGSD